MKHCNYKTTYHYIYIFMKNVDDNSILTPTRELVFSQAKRK